jgi:hypothetical protein
MIDWLIDHLAVIMFVALVFIMFLGYPVAFLLGAIGIGFGLLGILFDVYSMTQFANLLPRIYGTAMQNQVLVAIPMFVFMGTMLEKSGVAEDLLKILQLMLRRVPGGLAIAVTLLGTIMAATTGIVGASVIMLTLIALPVMLQTGYDKSLSVGTIASAGTLGILIPPSITERSSVAIAASKPSTGIVSMPPTGAGPPALLNRQSMRPCRAIVKSISAFTCASSVTSVRRNAQRAPIEACTARPSASRRPAITTWAPCAANTSAVRRPMPLVAPVTMQTLS